LYSDKETKIAQADLVQSQTAGSVSWFLPICGVASLAAGMSIFAMRRRREARSTRTLEPQAVPLPTSDLSDGEEPLLSNELEV